MTSSTIATLVKYLNIASIIILAVFAVVGVVAIFNKKLRAKALLSAFCAAALAAFAVEVTFFNFQHYLKLFAGPELEIAGVSPEDPNIVLTTAGTRAELLSEKDEKSNASMGIYFKNVNMKVTSIFVEMNFGDADACGMTVQWVDKQGARSFKKEILKRFPHENYSPLQPCGTVSEIKIMFTGANNTIEITQVAFNKRIPFYFSGLRLIVVSLLLFAAFCFFREKPRAEAAYYLFEYKFNPADRKQNIIYALSAVILIVFSYLCVNTSYPKSYLEIPVHQQYNKFLVDALANGRTWLDFGTPENLLKAERPYDNDYRLTNGYKFNSDVMWDWAWYKGKFYCYFGVVPAVILYLPYKLITGEYLSNSAGIFLFASIIIVLMAMLWRFCVKKYMPNAGFAFYMLSFPTLFFASGIFAQLRFTRVYSIVQTAGLMFALAGCYLLLKSVENEKVNRLKLFFACLCLALIAGCRPNMIFISLLIPVVLWKHRSWKLLLFVMIPYVIVAVPLCLYNYARFGSIFEFGVKYNLTGSDISLYKLLNPLGRIINICRYLLFYLLAPNEYALYFPFVQSHQYDGVGVGSGVINSPIVFCLPYLFKNILNKKRRITSQYPLLSFVIIAMVIAIADSLMAGFGGRYTLDFAFFFILPSLFCAYYWCMGSNGTLPNNDRQRVALILLAVSVFVGLFLCVSGAFPIEGGSQIHYDPVLYRYLEYSLGIFRDI